MQLNEFRDWLYYFARNVPNRLLAPLLHPLGWRLNTQYSSHFENARMIAHAYSLIWNNKCEGDYAEFGVFRGHTFVESFLASKRKGMQTMKFFAFDSFEGLPEPKDADVGGQFLKGEFSASRELFEKELRRNKVDMSRVEIVPGYFDATLTRSHGLTKVAIAFVDCDLYISTKPVLDYLTDKLIDGAVLIFDDWFCFKGRPDKGQQKAVREWLLANPQIQLREYNRFHWGGLSFIVNRL